MKKLALIFMFVLVPMAVTSADENTDRVKANLEAILPAGTDITAIAESPMPGVHQVTVGSRTFYAVAEGKFLLLGDVYDTVRQVSLADELKAENMFKAIDGVPKEQMVVFGPESASRHITVFTDVDCGYCRKLHNEVPTLNKAGLQVRYMAFPRAGIGSDSYKKIVSVWCADDQQATMTLAKSGQIPEPKTCENPVADHYRIGQEVGVQGTPTIVFDDGNVLPGYLPAEQLLNRVGLH